MERRRTWGTRIGSGPRCAWRFEGAHGDLEAVDHLTGAAGVDGVFGEAVDDGCEGVEDAGAVLDGRNLHAGDFGVDEDAVVFLVVGLDQVVIAVIFAFDGGRAAAFAGWSLIVIALVVAVDVWKRLRHGSPWGIGFCRIFQTNHLAAMILKTKEMFFKINKTLELWFLWSLIGRGHKPAAGGFCLYPTCEYIGRWWRKM
jgi:hypothetical protein